ncbi:MAG: RNA-binding protein [Methylococcaceae bacterium]|nr:RNA-binding protein [Methylococcaceae bacterium]
MDNETSQRLDKWLWAARFFKTRKLATEAISGGKVHLNGQRSKPGKEVKTGNKLSISKGPYRWELTVTGLSKQRKPASEAALLYEESPESLALRQARIEQRKAEFEQSNPPETRPNKKQRRQIHRFKRE